MEEVNLRQKTMEMKQQCSRSALNSLISLVVVIIHNFMYRSSVKVYYPAKKAAQYA